MEENKTFHKFEITITAALYEKIKAEHALHGKPTASYAVIGKLIETIEKRYKSIELNYRGR